MKALFALAAALFLANGWAQDMRLESAEGAGAADCFEQIRKQRTLEFDPKRGLTGGVDNTDWSETSALLVRLTFTAADAPPAVELLYAAGDRKLIPIVERAVAQYRLSCLPPGLQKVVTTQRFVRYGDGAKVLQLKRELTLVELLRLAPDVKAKPVRFDFNTMACPFQLEFAPYRPYTRNTVSEVGGSNPGRREFLGWLQDITLDLPPQFMRTAMGSRSLVTVPCTVLDLS
jgi:hypothetical protein